MTARYRTMAEKRTDGIRSLEEMRAASAHVDALCRQIAEREADGRLPPKGPWASDPGPEVRPRTRVIALHIEGWTTARIAERVGMGLGEVEGILRRARRY